MAIMTGETPAEVAAKAGAPIPEPIQQIGDDGLAKQNAVRADRRLTNEAKAESLAEIERATKARVDAEYEKLLVRRDLDQREGAARAALLDAPPTHEMLASDGVKIDTLIKMTHRRARQAEESIYVASAPTMTEGHELERDFDFCEAKGYERAMTRLVSRAEELAQRARQESPKTVGAGAETSLAAKLKSRLMTFRAANPTPVEALKQIDRERREHAHELERRRAIWFRLYGWRDDPLEQARQKAEQIRAGKV